MSSGCICLDEKCRGELIEIKSKRYPGWGFDGCEDVCIYRCSMCGKEYQKINVFDEEASADHDRLIGEIEPRTLTDEKLEKAKDSRDLDSFHLNKFKSKGG